MGLEASHVSASNVEQIAHMAERSMDHRAGQDGRSSHEAELDRRANASHAFRMS